MKNHEPESFVIKSTRDTAKACVNELLKKHNDEHKDAEVTGDFTDDTNGTFTITENKISNTVIVKIRKASTKFSVSSPSLTVQKGLRNLLETSANIVFGNKK